MPHLMGACRFEQPPAEAPSQRVDSYVSMGHRWSLERYSTAQASLVSILRGMGAEGPTTAVLRPTLREEARKSIGDTGDTSAQAGCKQMTRFKLQSQCEMGDNTSGAPLRQTTSLSRSVECVFLLSPLLSDFGCCHRFPPDAVHGCILPQGCWTTC